MSDTPRHVLLVEDEPGTMTTVALLLEMLGHRVSRAANGKRALALLQQEQPDVVVTDYMMPHMNGLELIAAMKADASLAAVPIVLTSAAMPAHVDREVAADAFLRKPYRIDELTGAIDRALQRRRTPPP